jgi:autotransporter-associated beta strand protein
MFSLSSKNTNRIISVAAVLASAGGANAATVVWNGNAADRIWDSAANWSAGVLPNDIAQFQEGGFNSGDLINVLVPQTVNRLAFNFTSSNVASKDLTLAGATLTLTGTLANNVGLNRQNTVSGVQAIDNNLLLGTTQKWNVNGATGAPAGVGRLVVNGVVGETGATGPAGIIKDGNTNLELNGDNTYTGPTTIIQNTIVVGHANALGLATSPVLVGDTVVNTSQSNLVTKTGVTFARDVVVRSGQTGGSRLGGADANGNTTWTGTVAIKKDVVLTGGLGLSTGTVDFQGNLVDGDGSDGNAFVSSNVTKANGGRVRLSGDANSYSGTTTISAGRLLVNGVLTPSDATVTVASGARLGGFGTINRPVNVAGGAIVQPGEGGPGVLTVASGKTVTWGDGGVLEVELGPTPENADRLDAPAVSFGPTAILKVLGGSNHPDAGVSYDLVRWTGQDPANLARWSIDAASAFTGTIAYVGATDGAPGGAVVFSNAQAAAVPEPGAAALSVTGGVILGQRRRHRRR